MDITLSILCDEIKRAGHPALVMESTRHDIYSVVLLSDLVTGSAPVSNRTVIIVDEKFDVGLSAPEWCYIFTDRASIPHGYSNYLVVPDQSSASAITILIQGIIIKLMDWKQRLHRATSNKVPFTEFLRIAEELMPDNVTFLSVYHDKFYSSTQAPEIKSENWDIIFRSYYDPEFDQSGVTSQSIIGLHSKRSADTISYGANGDTVAFCNVFDGDMRVGVLVSRMELDPCPGCCLAYLQESSKQIAKYFTGFADSSPSRLQHCLKKLCLREELTESELSLVTSSFSTGNTYRVAVIYSNGRNKNQFLNDRVLYRAVLSRVFPHSTTLVIEDFLVMIRDFTTYDVSKDSMPMVYLKQFLTKIEAALGFSMPFSDISDLYDFYQQVKAVSSGATAYRSQIHDYTSYLHYDVIRSFSESHNLEHYIHPDIQLLAEWDERKNNDFIRTLFYYLLNDRSLKACSDKMHVHRNTFAYRISRIQQLISSDLSSEDDRLALLLSILMYWQIYGK